MQGEDADILGHELASLTYNRSVSKDELFSTRQRLAGHRIVELSSWGKSEQDSKTLESNVWRGLVKS